MEYRALGRSGLKVSPLCLGSMMFGGPTDEADSARIIARAKDAGINFVDTADVYNDGASEEVATEGGQQPTAQSVRLIDAFARQLGAQLGRDPSRPSLLWVRVPPAP
jgi:aryl-alcohol dehydrogenase (NADP+)